MHAPPKLLGVKNNEARRPGKSKDLILLNGDKRRISENSIKNKNKPFKETKTKKKVKQKISLAKQQMLETDRMAIIEQYRAIKQKSHHF